MAANECWLDQTRSEKRSKHASTTTIKPEDSFGSLLGRVYSQNPAETVEKTAIDLVVQ